MVRSAVHERYGAVAYALLCYAVGPLALGSVGLFRCVDLASMGLFRHVVCHLRILIAAQTFFKESVNTYLNFCVLFFFCKARNVPLVHLVQMNPFVASIEYGTE